MAMTCTNSARRQDNSLGDRNMPGISEQQSLGPREPSGQQWTRASATRVTSPSAHQRKEGPGGNSMSQSSSPGEGPLGLSSQQPRAIAQPLCSGMSLTADRFHSPELKHMMALKLIKGPQYLPRIGLGCAGWTPMKTRRFCHL